MYNVFVVEDHEIFRKGIETLLEEIKDVNYAGSAGSGERFLEELPGLDVDIVFMDIKMSGIDGIEATKRALEKNPDLKIIALTMFSEEEFLQQMLEAGASGFLLKNVTQLDIEKAINAVMSGNRYFSEELMTTLANKYIGKNSPSADSISFNEKELQILQMICEGYTNIEIGEKIFLSHRTVDGLRAKMIEKTNSTNTVGLVVYAIKNKLVKV
jgi:DNA-binding NarL/FixJ family response regulator